MYHCRDNFVISKKKKKNVSVGPLKIKDERFWD